VRKTAPLRMCVGCGERAAQPDLLRFSLSAAGLLVKGTGQGRSGYLHPREKCVQTFVKARSGFVRSLRAVVSSERRAQYIAELGRDSLLLS
jgi:predicted RNA-binding protein YlxR (DUF448 family)